MHSTPYWTHLESMISHTIQAGKTFVPHSFLLELHMSDPLTIPSDQDMPPLGVTVHRKITVALADLVDFLLCQFDLQALDKLIQAVRAADANNGRGNPSRLEHPGEGYLCHRYTFRLRNLFDSIDYIDLRGCASTFMWLAGTSFSRMAFIDRAAQH